MARAIPHSSGQISAAWSPAVMPMRVCPSASTTSSPMMAMSAISAVASPAPAAPPLMAEMIGLSQLTMLNTRSRASVRVCTTPA